MKFIELTHRDSQRTILLNSERIDSIDPEQAGCIVRTGEVRIAVAENHRQVLNMIENSTNQKEKRSGKTRF